MQDHDAGKALLKVAEACSRLRIGRTQMYAMIRDGVIPAVRVGASGRGIRLRESDLEDFQKRALRWGSARRPPSST
jgi:excisionase family DNA binding protein